MTTILGTGVAMSSAPQLGREAKGPTIDPNAFLKLLVAELQYQDPTKPMDSTQLVNQLSAMSQVQMAGQTNAMLSSILDQLAVGQSAALIGRSITSADGTISGKIESVRVSSEGLYGVLSNGKELLLSEGVTIGQ